MTKVWLILGLFVSNAACANEPSPAGPADVLPVDGGMDGATEADAASPAPLSDSGILEDAAVPPLQAEVTCESQSFWLGGDAPSAEMNPGLACRSCHVRSAPELAYFFSGTVFGSRHEQDLCNSPPPEGARIEILNAAGEIALTLLPNAAGNFISKAREPGFPLPYRARVVVGDVESTMQSLQQNGDCNTCHTEQGQQGAPGRIVWPGRRE